MNIVDNIHTPVQVFDYHPSHLLGCGLLLHAVRVKHVETRVFLTVHVSKSPRSMKGGDLHWIWKPYALYQDIDYVSYRRRSQLAHSSHGITQVYGLRSFESGDGFTNAQCT